MTIHLRHALAVVCGLAVSFSGLNLQAADSLTIDFESSPALGQLPGGVDARTPGDDGQWWVPDNAATFGEVRTGIGLTGSNGLAIGNRGNGNDGVIHNVQSPRLAETAGESTAPASAPNARFTSSYWFRTAPMAAVDDFRFRSETWGPDRTTFFGLDGESNSPLTAYAYGMDAGTNFVQTPIASGLQWGEWYKLETVIDFVDGGVANDVVNYRLYDTANALVGSATSTTWEEGARQLGYNSGNVFGVDAVQFTARGGFTGDAAFVDNLSYSVSAIPEPASGALAGAAALGLFVVRRRRK
jgi:MYXO-CTERM domain-containing protein